MFLFSLMKKEPKKSRKKEASTHKASPGPPFFQACAHLPIKSLAVKQESSVVNPFDVIAVQVTLTDASLPAQTSSEVNVTINGAALGDFVLVSGGVDLAGLILTGYVSAANTVTIQAFNTEGSDAVTALSGGAEANVLVLKPKGVFNTI